MRIECDKCAAKYSIADEKVRGKTFKIRCKKCSNVIIVRDKAAAAGGAEAADDGAEPAPSEEPTGWHLAIDGETVGPLA
ncbi:MAG: zinc-ribbon domain-containing protein, partial [Myxococcales bacterium]|nr:zinc-ribbon domain-containing protein [Myxococcales bacterium]